MQALKSLLYLTLLSLAFVVPLAQTVRAETAADSFQRMRDLAGTWTVTADGETPTSATIEVVSDGSAIAERFDGMITMYTLEEDTIVATHYCSAHNQPHLRAQARNGDGPLVFAFESVSGTHSPGEGFMSSLAVTFDGPNVIHEAWTYRDGGVDQPVSTFTLTRQKTQ